MTNKLFMIFLACYVLSCSKTHEQNLNSEQNEVQSSSYIPPLSPFSYCNTDPNPIGGGTGYNQIYTSQDADIYIESYLSAANFKNTIENAPIGSLIFINGTLTIDLSNFFNLTGSSSIFVPSGVTIASSRGLDLGALVYTSDVDYNTDFSTPKRAPLFVCKGNNIRFTGLRFEGPFQLEGVRSPDKKIRSKTCIEISNNYQGLQVDNCVFFGWPHAAVRIGKGYNDGSFINNRIHHNYFFNNRQKGLGYGVSIDSGYAKIYSNIFEKNRHDIAGTGKKGCGYEASCNTILQGGTSHNFDMHGDRVIVNDVKVFKKNAGHFIYIHHNDFKDIGNSRSNDEDENEYNIKIRGRPDFQCRVENNRFAYYNPTAAVHQSNTVGGFGNMLVWNNLYNTNEYLGWYVQHKWLKTRPNNFLSFPSSNDLLMVNPTNVNSNYIYAYNFGDYDGDGNTDVFKLENGKLYRIPLDASSYSQATNWEQILSTGMSMSDLRFGFFNGDNLTDVIRKSGNTIFVSWGANTSWSTLTTTGYSLQDLRFGDFDGNGITDLFSTTGALWQVSLNSNSNWQTINASSYQSNQLLLGWFNNNNKSDVFLANGADFKVSYEGTSSWNTTAASSYLTNQLIVADFNGDNISDVISPNRKVSLSGNTTWKECNTNNFPVTAFKYGNF